MHHDDTSGVFAGMGDASLEHLRRCLVEKHSELYQRLAKSCAQGGLPAARPVRGAAAATRRGELDLVADCRGSLAPPVLDGGAPSA